MRHDPDLRLKGGSLVVTCLLLVFFCLSSAANTVNAQTFAYVTHVGDDLVSVINTDTNSVVTTIRVGPNPAGLAITPDGTRVYVTNQVDHTVSVIETATNTVIATISVGSDTTGGFPQDVAITPDGTRAYVGGREGFAVIDTVTNTATAIPLAGALFIGVAITPDGTRVYAAPPRATRGFVNVNYSQHKFSSTPDRLGY